MHRYEIMCYAAPIKYVFFQFYVSDKATRCSGVNAAAHKEVPTLPVDQSNQLIRMGVRICNTRYVLL